MEPFLWILVGIIYVSGWYLHSLILRAIGKFVKAKSQSTWLLATFWPLIDVYVAIRVRTSIYHELVDNAGPRT